VCLPWAAVKKVCIFEATDQHPGLHVVTEADERAVSKQGLPLPVGMVGIGYLEPFWRLAGYRVFSGTRTGPYGYVDLQGPAPEFINIP
jgi:hypothetical protein